MSVDPHHMGCGMSRTCAPNIGNVLPSSMNHFRFCYKNLEAWYPPSRVALYVHSLNNDKHVSRRAGRDRVPQMRPARRPQHCIFHHFQCIETAGPPNFLAYEAFWPVFRPTQSFRWAMLVKNAIEGLRAKPILLMPPCFCRHATVLVLRPQA